MKNPLDNRTDLKKKLTRAVVDAMRLLPGRRDGQPLEPGEQERLLAALALLRQTPGDTVVYAALAARQSGILRL